MAESSLPDDFASRFEGVPADYVEKLGEWVKALKENLHSEGINPDSVSAAMRESMRAEGTGPLADAGSASDSELMADLVEMLRADLETEIPSLTVPDPNLKNLLGEVRALQEKTVGKLREGFTEGGLEIDDTTDAILKTLMGEDVQEHEIPPPSLDDLPPEVKAGVEELLAKAEELPEVEVPSDPEEMKKHVDKMKAKLKANLAADLAAAGLPAAAMVNSLLPSSPEEEEEALAELQEQIKMPEGMPPPPEDEAEAPSATIGAETSPEQMRDMVKDMQDKVRVDLAEAFKAAGADEGALLDALFPSSPEAERAALDKLAGDLEEQNK
ncbi:MAG: hypothetical protein ACYTFG_01825 [Planctomycetota bacterium]|jgi:hypothetical protein